MASGLIYVFALLTKACFKHFGLMNRRDVVFGYVVGVFTVIAIVGKATVTVLIIALSIASIVYFGETAATQDTTEAKEEGKNNSPSGQGQSDHSRDSKDKPKEFELLSVVCLNSRGRKSAKSCGVVVALINLRKVTEAKRRSGEEDGDSEKEMAEDSSLLEEVTVVWPKKPRKARQSRGEKNVECPPRQK